MLTIVWEFLDDIIILKIPPEHIPRQHVSETFPK